MFGFINKGFFTGLVFLWTLTSANLLSCISMKSQECKVKPQIVNVNGDDPMFFSDSVKTSKCNGSCNTINNPLAKMCVLDVVTNLNIKVFTLVSEINETRHKEWHETCKCKCRFEHSVFDNKQSWNDDQCRSDFSEYLDYKNCKCKKSWGDKLVEKYTENIEETKFYQMQSILAHGTLCYLHIILSLVLPIRQQFNELIDGKCQTNRDQKSNLLFSQRHYQSQNFESHLLKIDKKNIIKALMFTISDTLQLQKLAIVKILTV